MVAVFAHALAIIDNEVFDGDCDPGFIATAALFHDASEIFTGDLPTPVKYQSPEIQNAYKAVEAAATERLLSMLPPALQDSYRPLLHPDDTKSIALIKAADKLSAYVKCLEETKAGNREFHSAATQTYEALCSMNLPALHYFLAHCLPAFSLTLDELGPYANEKGLE